MSKITTTIMLPYGELSKNGKDYARIDGFAEHAAYLIPGIEGLCIHQAYGEGGIPFKCQFEKCSCDGWFFWNVTHIKTSRHVNGHPMGLFCQALKFAQDLGRTGVDWTKDYEDIQKDAHVGRAKALISLLEELADLCPHDIFERIKETRQ